VAGIWLAPRLGRIEVAIPYAIRPEGFAFDSQMACRAIAQPVLFEKPFEKALLAQAGQGTDTRAINIGGAPSPC
jgi:hypothetical protein